MNNISAVSRRDATRNIFVSVLAATVPTMGFTQPDLKPAVMEIRRQGQQSTADYLGRSVNRHKENAVIESEIVNAYQGLAARQKPLEPEFAEILSANLWDLYAR